MFYFNVILLSTSISFLNCNQKCLLSLDTFNADIYPPMDEDTTGISSFRSEEIADLSRGKLCSGFDLDKLYVNCTIIGGTLLSLCRVHQCI